MEDPKISSVDHANPGQQNIHPASLVKDLDSKDYSSVSAVHANDEAAGSRVHAFNPETSPQEKAALTLKEAASRNAPVEGAQLGRTNIGHELKSDIGAQAPKATVTSLADIQQATQQNQDQDDDKAVVIGALKDGKAPEIPDWYKVGWQQNSSTLANAAKSDQIQQRDLLSDFISETYYGTSWHNASIIFFAVFSSHFITRFGGGYGALLIICACCATYYSTSIKRVRHRARDDIQREMAKQALYTSSESADWLNNFLRRFWLAYEPLLSATIVLSVDQILSESCPAFLESLRLTTFTLGTKAPRIDFVKTYADTDDETVVMDMKISFTPNDTADLTPAQAAGKVNQKIVLSIKVGKGIASISKDIVVEDITFAGVMRFRLKLMSNFPNIKTVEFSFIEQPLIDFVLKPIGFDLSIIPGLENFIHSQLHANLGPMMYDPNSFALDLEQLLSGVPLDTAIGVVQVTVFSARGIKATKIGGGSPDPYVSFSISQRGEIARTKTKNSTSDPRWNETKFVLVNSLQDVLAMTVTDWNEHRKDSQLGTASFSLRELDAAPEHELVKSPILLAGKERGELLYSIKYFPVLKPQKLADGTMEAVPESNSGIVRLVVHQAKELDLRKTLSRTQANPYARIYLQNQEVGTTRTLKRTVSPAWEQATEFLVSDKKAAVIGVKVCDERGSQTDPTLGFTNVPLELLLEAQAKQQDWFPLSDCATGRIRMTAEFKPVIMAGSVNGARGYTCPIGIIKLRCVRATDLKNVEVLGGGKSDPYVRVLLRGVVKVRTEVVNNNLNPNWDEYLYIPVHSAKDHLVVEVMDYEHTSKDRSLGSFELLASDLIAEGPDKDSKPWIAKERISKTEMLKSDNRKTVKGSVTFEATFHPAAPMPGFSFDPPPKPTLPTAEPNFEDNASTVQSFVIDANGHESDKVNQDMEVDSERLEITEARKEVESTPKIPATPAKVPAFSREQLLKTQTGILAFNIVGGRLSRQKARLEVLFDSGYWPAYSTEPARSLKPTWDECGDFFIKELDFSRVVFKLNLAEKETVDEVYAESAMDLNAFLEKALDNQVDLELRDAKGETMSVVTISARYIPVNYQLEPRESVNNTGNVRVELINAKDLRAADRNGYSDPYAVIELNGESVFKSQTIKKSLNPTWNESTTIAVPSRTAAQCILKVYDWDIAGSPDKLGQAQIDLSALEPFTSSSVTVNLADAATGARQGVVNLRLLFRPEFLDRSRAATSTFSSVQRRASYVGRGAGSVVGRASNPITSIGYRIAHGGHGKSTSTATVDPAETPSSLSSSSSPVFVNKTPGMQPDSITPPNGASEGNALEGTLRMTVLSAKADSEEKVVAVLKSNGKSIEKSHETYSISTSGSSCQIGVQLIHKKTFGKDEILGSAEFNAWSYVGASKQESVATIACEPEGSCEIQLEWTAINRTSTDSPASVKTAGRSRFTSSRFTKEKTPA